MNLSIKKMAKEIVRINEKTKNKPQPYDTSGEVKRVKDGVAYVKFQGAEDETPVDMTINCKPGDNVKVRINNRRAWITGNATAPPTDDKAAYVAQAQAVKAESTAKEATNEAKIAQETANVAEKEATNAATVAEGARQLSYDTSQYFWNKSTGGTGDIPTGAYITEIPQDQFTDPNDENYYCKGGNLLARTDGIHIRKDKKEVSCFKDDGMLFNTSEHDNVFKINATASSTESKSFWFAFSNTANVTLPYGCTYDETTGNYVRVYGYSGNIINNVTVSTTVSSNRVVVNISAPFSSEPKYGWISYNTPPAIYAQIGVNPSLPNSHVFTVGNGFTSGNTKYNSNAFYIDLDGSTYINGSLIIEGHETAIGTILKSIKNKTISHNQWTSSGAGIMLGKGAWIVFGKMFTNAPTGSSGRMGVRLKDDDYISRSQLINQVTYAGSIETVIPIVSYNTNYNVYLYGYQSTGDELNCDFVLSAIRIA